MTRFGRMALAGLMLAMAGCGLGSGKSVEPAAAAGAWEQPIPRAVCGPNDRPEVALSGQVPLSERVSLRSLEGYRCNLELVGQHRGQGAEIQHTVLGDCAYYAQSSLYNRLGEARPEAGVVVVDVADSTAPKQTALLNTAAMLSPWESLKANGARKLLGAMFGSIPEGGPEIDVYSLASDCRQPQLLFSGVLGDGTHTGHEGEWTPDGRTYWGSSTGEYFAVDMENPAEPDYLLSWVPAEGGTHGLSVSKDGSRTYFVTTTVMQGETGINGFVVADTSDVQARKPNGEIRILGSYTWDDGAQAQHTIPVKIGGKPFLIHADEFGAGGLGASAAWASACAAGLPPWAMVRVFDMADETRPVLASKLMLDVNDPANCDATLPDNGNRVVFGYDSHYCAVDNPDDTKLVACAWFSSGLRVFDVSNPYRPKEYGYYLPPIEPGVQLGSGNNFAGTCEGVDWVIDQPHFRNDRNEIWFTSTCGGFQVLRLTAPRP